MPVLIKYAVVTASGNWLTLGTHRGEAERISLRHDGTHVERWVYHERPDGTHDDPIKTRLPFMEK
jgi:hypothetical protein